MRQALIIETQELEAELFSDALGASFEVREQILHDRGYRQRYVLRWLDEQGVAIDAGQLAVRLGQVFMACYGRPIQIFA
jgi:hypothetical protein